MDLSHCWSGLIHHLPFDILDHGIVLGRFEHLFGITGTAVDWIVSYLHDRYQKVDSDGERFGPVLLEHGV